MKIGGKNRFDSKGTGRLTVTTSYAACVIDTQWSFQYTLVPKKGLLINPHQPDRTVSGLAYLLKPE
jgi:hypothetical protein